MTYFWMIIKGMFMGIANVIPGVSGGTMAVSFGIYDDVIHSVTHIRKEFKTSMKVLLPLIIGAVLGIIGFSFAIVWLLDHYTLYTAFAFVGLILGGLPILTDEFKDNLRQANQRFNIVHIIIVALFIGIVAWMGVTDVAESGLQSVAVSPGSLIMLFIVGVLSAAAMVVPGVSGSLLMMILGYYYVVINSINTFTSALTSFNLDALIPVTILLSAFGIGMLVGLGLISKLIDFLFKSYPQLTYAGIIGLVLGSPIAVIANTNAFAGLSGGSAVIQLIIALVLAVACFILTYKIGQLEDTTEEIPEESKSAI